MIFVTFHEKDYIFLEIRWIKCLSCIIENLFDFCVWRISSTVQTLPILALVGTSFFLIKFLIKFSFGFPVQNLILYRFSSRAHISVQITLNFSQILNLVQNHVFHWSFCQCILSFHFIKTVFQTIKHLNVGVDSNKPQIFFTHISAMQYTIKVAFYFLII